MDEIQNLVILNHTKLMAQWVDARVFELQNSFLYINLSM